MAIGRSFGIILCIGVLIASIGLPLARAATIGVSISQNSITLSMELRLVENLTNLPTANIVLLPSNSTALLTPIQTAIDRLVPGATVNGLNGRVESRQGNATLQSWILDENFSFTVSGASDNLGGAVKSNLSLVSMNVSDPIRLDGLEMNALGGAYLLGGLEGLPTTTTTAWFDNDAQFSNSLITANSTAGFHLLDFTWVSHLQFWNHEYTTFDPSVWTLTPRSPFNITVGIRQVENTYTPIYQAVYVSSIELTAPPSAWSEGDTVWFNISTPAELAMPIILGSSLVILAGAMIVDRRLTRPLRIGRKKKR